MPATLSSLPARLPAHQPTRLTAGRSLVTRVVIVGSGPARLAAYRALLRAAGRAVRSGDVHLTVISETPDVHAPDLHADVLAGHLPAESARTPLRTLLPRATVLVGRVVQADLTMQRLQVSRADHDPCWLGFDHLILGDDRPDAPTAALADRLGDHPPVRVTVLGGDVAGAELALAVREWQRERDLGGSVTLRCGGELLSAQPGLSVPVRAALGAAGVTVHELAHGTGSDGRDDHDLTVVTDAAPHVLPGTETLPRTPGGFLLTDAALRVPDPTSVWAARTAAHGWHAGQNVARTLCRRGVQPFPAGPHWTARSVRLGHWNAVTHLRSPGPGTGLTLGGRLGWLARSLLIAAQVPRPADRGRVLLSLLRPAPRAEPDAPAKARTPDRPTPV